MDVPIACPCPAGHPEDTVVLRERLDFRSATTIRKAVAIARDEEGVTDPAEVLAIMTEWYCLFGIESWTLTDDRGKPVPVTRQTIRERLLENPDAVQAVLTLADAADELYMVTVLLPLLARASTSSAPTPTAPSTSAPKDSGTRHPKPSRRSSTTSSPTGDTVTTSASPGGVSSFSPSSVSAA